MLHALSLGLFLSILWMLLSGHTDPLLLGLGAASVSVVVLISHRMDLIDHEGHPVHLTWRSIFYWPWLIWQIIKANVDVARIILKPKMPISPNVFHTKGSQKSDLGYVIYANSITLTPGTVSVALENGVLSVHALTAEAAADVEAGEMDRRVTAMEGLNGETREHSEKDGD